MTPDKLQLQRLEYKYLIREPLARQVRSFAAAHLELDEYGVNQPENSYRVHSLYLDSPNLKTYWDTINGDRNRFKLRLRYYSEEPGSPVFFEIKRRCDEAIRKQRGGVRREAVAGLLSGQLPDPEHLLSAQPRQFVALQRFCQLMLDLRATPKAHVCYLREAWVSTNDNSVRVTMDRDVRVAPETTGMLRTTIRDYVKPFDGFVILELKFTGRFPNWFRNLVETLGLRRGSAAKYADGVTLIGENRFHPGHIPSPAPNGRQRLVRPEDRDAEDAALAV